MKPAYKKVGLVALVLTIAGIAVAAVSGAFRKKYTFDWAGGQKVVARNDGKWYSGLHITTPGGNTSLKVGDYVNVESADAPGLAGRHKVIQLGSDDGTYDGTGMVVIDVVKDTPGLDTIGGGTLKKA